MKKFLAVFLAVALTIALATVALAAPDNSNGKSNGNNKNKNAEIELVVEEPIDEEPAANLLSTDDTAALVAESSRRLHQYTGNPIAYKDFYDPDESVIANTANIPDCSNDDPYPVFWHFVDPSKSNGTADFVFQNGEGEDVRIDNISSYKNGQHWGVITPSDWTLLDAWYMFDVVPVPSSLKFNLSHTAGGPPDEPPPEGGFSTVVSFSKDIGRMFDGEAFSFKLYKIEDGEAYVNEYTTDELGLVSFVLGNDETPEVEEIGSYVLYEVPTPGWTQKTYVNGLRFTITAEGLVVWELEQQDIDEGKEAPVVVNEEESYSFWAALHLSIVSNGESETATATAVEGTQYSNGQGWGFTYLRIEDLSRSNPLTFDIVSGKVKNRKFFGTVTLSLNGDRELVVTIDLNDGVTLSTDREAVKLTVSANESDMIKTPGKFEYKVPAPAVIDGVATIVVPKSVFDMADYRN